MNDGSEFKVCTAFFVDPEKKIIIIIIMMNQKIHASICDYFFLRLPRAVFLVSGDEILWVNFQYFSYHKQPKVIS